MHKYMFLFIHLNLNPSFRLQVIIVAMTLWTTIRVDRVFWCLHNQADQMTGWSLECFPVSSFPPSHKLFISTSRLYRCLRKTQVLHNNIGFGAWKCPFLKMGSKCKFFKTIPLFFIYIWHVPSLSMQYMCIYFFIKWHCQLRTWNVYCFSLFFADLCEQGFRHLYINLFKNAKEKRVSFVVHCCPINVPLICKCLKYAKLRIKHIHTSYFMQLIQLFFFSH